MCDQRIDISTLIKFEKESITDAAALLFQPGLFKILQWDVHKWRYGSRDACLPGRTGQATFDQEIKRAQADGITHLRIVLEQEGLVNKGALFIAEGLSCRNGFCFQ